MTARTLPQQHCRNLTDHPTHTVWPTAETVTVKPYRCPGRYTPSNHRAPHASPAVPTDPFAGIPGADDDEEF